jgi:signal transduction histidine kinase
MTSSIRFRFFAWLGLQTVLIFAAIGAVLLVFNLHERHEHPDLVEEEAEEALIVAGVMAAMLPLAFGSAWYISRRLLRPWQQLVTQSEHIRAGHLDERIRVANPDDEIGRLAFTLNDAFDRYQTLLDRIQRFSYDASHQLRNPLAAMRTAGEVCLRQPRDAEEYVSVIGGMLEDAARLHRTVEQLLMLARAAQGALDEQRQETCLQDIAREVAEEARAIGETRNLRIALDAPDRPVRVSSVPDLLREALRNLVDNALRFAPDDSAIVVSIAETPDGGARIGVADSGPGCSPEKKRTLFQPFNRDRGGRRESVGLGLAIVSDICRAHGGRAGVDDNPAGGSVFWIELPDRKTRIPA